MVSHYLTLVSFIHTGLPHHDDMVAKGQLLPISLLVFALLCAGAYAARVKSAGTIVVAPVPPSSHGNAPVLPARIKSKRLSQGLLYFTSFLPSHQHALAHITHHWLGLPLSVSRLVVNFVW